MSVYHASSISTRCAVLDVVQNAADIVAVMVETLTFSIS
jgi:hypothetical protein